MRTISTLTSPDSVSSLLGKERAPQRKSVSPMVPVLLALVLLLVALAFLRMLAPQQPAPKTLQIVGAGQDIFPGTRITFRDLHYITIPENYYADGMSSKTNLLVGRTARIYVGKGEPVLESNLFSGKENLAQAVENHERAVTLKLDDYSLVDHSISSGDRVDVLVTTIEDGKKYTKTVCQSLKVLFSMPREALHSSSLRGQEANHITLVVSPAQAEILAQAEESGKIKLSLRNRLATELPVLSGVSETDLLPPSASRLLSAKASNNGLIAAAPQVVSNLLHLPGLIPPPLPPVPAAKPLGYSAIDVIAPVSQTARWVVEIFSGNKRELYEVPAINK